MMQRCEAELITKWTHTDWSLQSASWNRNCE